MNTVSQTARKEIIRVWLERLETTQLIVAATAQSWPATCFILGTKFDEAPAGEAAAVAGGEQGETRAPRGSRLLVWRSVAGF